jgi:hypothetical protein
MGLIKKHCSIRTYFRQKREIKALNKRNDELFDRIIESENKEIEAHKETEKSRASARYFLILTILLLILLFFKVVGIA